MDYTKIKLDAEQLYRLNFDEFDCSYWHDIDSIVKIYELEDGTYQQYIDEEERFLIGIPLKTVGDLMKRYNSLTGFELKYWDKDYPQTAQ